LIQLRPIKIIALVKILAAVQSSPGRISRMIEWTVCGSHFCFARLIPTFSRGEGPLSNRVCRPALRSVQLFVFDQFFNGACQDRKTALDTFRFQEEDLILYHRIPRKVVLFVEFHAAFLRAENGMCTKTIPFSFSANFALVELTQ
jgi:hypothetical protein